MNILPKKRWHVRNRENIARVRKDEAQAAEEEKKRIERQKLAEREARRELLLNKSRRNLTNQEFIPLDSCKKETSSKDAHINFFEDLEEGSAEQKKDNKEHNKEVKEEREKYEKQIGYLTYLGQDTNEALGKKSWYDVAPDRTHLKEEVNMKSKIREDPLGIMKKYESIGKTIDQTRKSYEMKMLVDLNKRKSESEDSSSSNNKKSRSAKKHRHMLKKPRKSSSGSSSLSDSDDDLNKKRKLETLRMERLKRERDERRKTEEFLQKLHGEKTENNKIEKTFKSKYNSQFNPELAKQNYKYVK